MKHIILYMNILKLCLTLLDLDSDLIEHYDYTNFQVLGISIRVAISQLTGQPATSALRYLDTTNIEEHFLKNDDGSRYIFSTKHNNLVNEMINITRLEHDQWFDAIETVKSDMESEWTQLGFIFNNAAKITFYNDETNSNN